MICIRIVLLLVVSFEALEDFLPDEVTGDGDGDDEGGLFLCTDDDDDWTPFSLTPWVDVEGPGPGPERTLVKTTRFCIFLLFTELK